MAVTTALVVGAAVAGTAAYEGAQSQKKAAKAAGDAFAGVGNNMTDMSGLQSATSQLMGDTSQTHRYTDMQTAAINLMQQQMNGQVSDATKRMLGMRAVESGATGIGSGAVGNNYAAWLGLDQMQLQQQGLDNYRGYLNQLMQAGQQQMSINYGKDYNAAAARAGVAMQKGAADAGMWNGIGQIGGALMGYGMGGGSGGGMGMLSGMFGGGSSSTGGGNSKPGV